jgi:hypothetical protein
MKNEIVELLNSSRVKSNVVKGKKDILVRKVKIIFKILTNKTFRARAKQALNKAFRADLGSRMGVESIPVSQLVDWGNLDLKLQNATQAAGQTSHLELLCILANVKEHILPGQNFLEIGTYDGNTALNVAINLSEGSKIFTIDLPYEDSSTASFAYDDALVRNPQRQKKKHLAMDNVTQIFADSTKFDFSEIDFHGAFIDGGHDFETVKADTINVLTNIQRPGFVIWHDYEVECEIGDVLHALIPQYKVKHIEGTRMGFLYLSA